MLVGTCGLFDDHVRVGREYYFLYLRSFCVVVLLFAVLGTYVSDVGSIHRYRLL